MTTSTSVIRDHRIDFVRGLALIMIFINHIPGNLWSHATNKNFGVSDSAEVFVLLAGYASALAYYHRFSGGQPFETTIRVARRAGHLYVVHIFITVLAVAMFAAAALHLAEPQLTGEINIGPLITDPVAGFVGLVTLSHQLGYFNILPLYIVLLLLLPSMMALYKLDARALLFGSIALYLLVGFTRTTLPSFPGQHTWFFNPLSWQVLFVAGFIWGARRRAGLDVPYNRTLFWVCLVYLVVALVWVRMPSLWPQFPKTEAIGALWGFSKTYLAPFRLLHVLALAYVIAWSPVGRWMRVVPASSVIVDMGRHALPVFAVGSLMSMAFMIVRTHLGGGIVVDTLSVATGIATMVVLAKFLSWQSRSPAGQVGSVAASGFVAATPPVPPPSMGLIPPPPAKI